MSSIIQFNARDRGNVPGILSNWNWVHFSKFSTFVTFPDTIQARDRQGGGRVECVHQTNVLMNKKTASIRFRFESCLYPIR